jgi:hypothetical protein
MWTRAQALDVAIEIPRCGKCALPREPEPLFEEALIKLIVGRAFAKRLRKDFTER